VQQLTVRTQTFADANLVFASETCREADGSILLSAGESLESCLHGRSTDVRSQNTYLPSRSSDKPSTDRALIATRVSSRPNFTSIRQPDQSIWNCPSGLRRTSGPLASVTEPPFVGSIIHASSSSS